MSSTDVLGVTRAIDVGVLTIVPTEVEALFAALGIASGEYVAAASPLQYWRTSYLSRSSGRELSIVVSFVSGEAGNTEAGVSTAYFLRDWHPRLMCLVGIAAGLKGKTRIGDVVVPSKIHDRTTKAYENAAYRVRGRTFERHEMLNRMLKVAPLTSERLIEGLRSTAGGHISAAQRAAESKGVTIQEFDGDARIIDGSIASDNVLIRDPSYFDGILDATDEKCRGGEMEAAGFVLACLRERPDFPWLVVRGVSDFGDSAKDDSFQVLAANAACVALKLLLQQTISVNALPSNPRELETSGTLAFNLVNQLKEAFAAQRWSEVCRIGAVLSRPLWLSGHAALRYELGCLVESAAAFAGEPELRARVLIDDLGWTSVSLGQQLRAEKHIRDGVRLATECGDNYVIAKGQRHLASLRRRAADLRAAQEFLEAADAATRAISDDTERSEMLSSLQLSRAKLAFANGDYKNAANLFGDALRAFVALGDTEREAKVYTQLGLCAEKAGDGDVALTYYMSGRTKARDNGRFDEFAANTQGAMRILGQASESTRSLAREVHDFAIAHGLWHEAREWQIGHGLGPTAASSREEQYDV